MNTTNKIVLAIAATLAMPAAFAQTTPAAQDVQQQQATPTSAQAAGVQQPTTEMSADPSAMQPKQITWADLDSDKDGSLTKTEAGKIPALDEVFEQADANADGKLSAEEYRTYAAKTDKPAGSSSGG